MKRAYYSGTIAGIKQSSKSSIIGSLTLAHQFALEDLQRNAWLCEIELLQAAKGLDDAYVMFEYAIPRMGKRVDVVLIHKGIVFVVEFKIGQRIFHRADIDQVLDYALDLKNFHRASHAIPIVPILVATDGNNQEVGLGCFEDLIYWPICVNARNFADTVLQIPLSKTLVQVDPIEWEASQYTPTPTIVEAAQTLYTGHDVKEISRSEASNLSETTDAISCAVESAKSERKKIICFVTGVPGAGKTLAGLNLATERRRTDESEHAVFLSGNGPLVQVLQEALARDEVQRSKTKLRKSVALSRTRAFIQNIHHFRDDALTTVHPPIEHVAVFDEAQRAWTREQTQQFMARKKGILDFEKSEPEFLIEVMDRHPDWAVIVCLIGGGQEINTGEAGLLEWFRALGTRFPNWHIVISESLTEYEYDWGETLYSTVEPEHIHADSRLHLAVSIRSFRSEKLSDFVKALLDCDVNSAKKLFQGFKSNYPIVLTRDIQRAKDWIRTQARGTERYGLVASSGAHRLRPDGITVKSKIEPKHWFLDSKSDVRSSYYLEEVATEFDIQGLELDWTLVAWDADFRMSHEQWCYQSFRGTEWQMVHDSTRRLYLKNAYRVLLTRARQGMVIYVPCGDPTDRTRLPEFYDRTFDYLTRLGIPDLT